jgi:nucleotide-binding universal stress UspA family protein
VKPGYGKASRGVGRGLSAADLATDTNLQPRLERSAAVQVPMAGWKKILVATDFSPCSRAALASARALAGLAGGSVRIVHVVEPLPVPLGAFVEDIEATELDRIRMEGAEERLERLLRRLRTSTPAIEGVVRSGRPWEEIITAARETSADLVCVGNSGHSGFARLLLGSTAVNVVRHSPVPVLVTRRRALGKVAKVLVPVDFEEGSERTLRCAAETFPRQTQIHALFVVPSPLTIDAYVLNYTSNQRAIERDLRSFVGRAGRPVKYEVRMFGDAATEILRTARRRGSDVILISTHGRRGLERFFLGSVADKVVRHADRPVLVLPGPGARP